MTKIKHYDKLNKFITDDTWRIIFNQFLDAIPYSELRDKEYLEVIGATYKLLPENYLMSNNSSLVNPKKLYALFKWYKKANSQDTSIVQYFPEYGQRVDFFHTGFNSNYGIYAYKKKGLVKCAQELIKNRNSRRACFMINNDEAMSEDSIDKLCTNAVMFFIKNNTLDMCVQMRSSNILTMLPYDIFMFCVFYYQVLEMVSSKYHDLDIGIITMQVGSLHMYKKDMKEIKSTRPLSQFGVDGSYLRGGMIPYGYSHTKITPAIESILKQLAENG